MAASIHIYRIILSFLIFYHPIKHMEEDPTNLSCNTWQPIVTYVLIFLNIMISVGKQFLNNSKHIKLKTNVDTILTGIKGNLPNTNTEGEGLMDLNIPENLRTSQRK